MHSGLKSDTSCMHFETRSSSTSNIIKKAFQCRLVIHYVFNRVEKLSYIAISESSRDSGGGESAVSIYNG